MTAVSSPARPRLLRLFEQAIEECPICEGWKEVPCDCHLCRSPEGQAMGVMGHVERPCPGCGGHGKVLRNCDRCDATLYPGAVYAVHDQLVCPECAEEG